MYRIVRKYQGPGRLLIPIRPLLFTAAHGDVARIRNERMACSRENLEEPNKPEAIDLL